MDATQQALGRVRRFAAAVSVDVPPVDEALEPLRRLLAAAGVEHRLVEGVAVVHHGYVRTTDDLDVLVDAEALESLAQVCAEHGFERVSRTRLTHLASGVHVDLLVAGEPVPRVGAGTYPAPSALAASPRDPAIVGLAGLLQLKLRAGRHQDRADVVALLKLLDDAAYDPIEAAIPVGLRPSLFALRRDALEELEWAARGDQTRP
ncbi:MAG: hypothetical protein IT373_12685 [Polyangiaceae bacterium]|nr:hypothetical protein [Polyangiaceae bacterium]